MKKSPEINTIKTSMVLQWTGRLSCNGISIDLEQASPCFSNLIEEIHSFKAQSLAREIWGQRK